MNEKTTVRAVVDEKLKLDFETIVKRNDRISSQVLRDLMREYIYRNSGGGVWEPGRRAKREESKEEDL